MSKNRAYKDATLKILAVIIVFFLSACGGGGGGGGGSTQTPTYVDINQQAKVDSSSIEGHLFGMRLWFSRTLTENVTSMFIDGTLAFQTGDVDLTVQNGCGGSVKISGTLDEASSSGTLTLDYSHYQQCWANYTYTFTGPIELSIYNTEEYSFAGNVAIPSAFLLSTHNLTVVLASESMQLDGTIEYDHDTSNTQYDTITLTKNFTLSDSFGAATYTNFVHKDNYTFKGSVSPSGYTSESYSGRLYDSDSGYIDVAMVNADAMCSLMGPLNLCPLDPTLQGRVKLIGDNSSALIQSGGILDRVSIDADGDGVYELLMQCESATCNYIP